VLFKATGKPFASFKAKNWRSTKNAEIVEGGKTVSKIEKPIKKKKSRKRK